MTPTTISLGITYSADQSAAAQSLGASATADPQKAMIQAVIDYINKRGGIAGRQIKPVWYEVQYTNNTDAVRAQEQCATFTEDHHVFAAGTFNTITGVQPTCLKKAGAVTIFSTSGYRPTFDNRDAATFGDSLYSPNVPTFNRVWQALVKASVQGGYFTKGAKVGVAIMDTPSYNRSVTETLAPALKKLGVTIADVCKIRVAADANDIAGVTTDSQNCNLRFNTEGVTHVMGGAAVSSMLLFGDGSYKPRPAVFSGGTGVDQTVGGQDLSSVWKNMVGIGWAPEKDAGTSTGPFAKTCLQIVKSAGVNQPHTDESLYTCDYFFFVKAALEHAPTFTPAGFAQGARAIGQLFTPSTVLQTRWDDGRHDGPSSYRKIVYDMACHNAGGKGNECFKYSGGLVPF